MSENQGLPVGRNIKIGFFHLGSGMADVITTGIWNRIMISDLGFAATPVGLLVSLRYFLAPFAVWAGRASDRRAYLGYRRLFWIWGGRLLMLLSVFGLGWATAALTSGADGLLPWVAIVLSMLAFSFGTAVSGSTFLALIYDRSTEAQRGRAVGIVWTFLLLGFTVGGIVFGILLASNPFYTLNYYLAPRNNTTLFFHQDYEFTPDSLFGVFLVAGLILGFLWFFSLLGEEKRLRGAAAREAVSGGEAAAEISTSVWADLRLVWRSPAMRFFLFYLALSMAFAFSQDLILEPFAGEVFNMPPHVTTRFAAYWGSTAIAGTVLFLFLSRRYKWLNNTTMSYMGVIVLVATFALFTLSAFAQIRSLVTPGLVLLGIGLGIWNVGTLGLMMDMSPAGRAGTFLGFWTLVVTLGRGVGVSGGGILRDIGVQLSGDPALAYGAAFAVGALGLALAYAALMRVNVRAYKAALGTVEPQPVDKVLVGAMD